MNVLVTGATGFIGSHLAERLGVEGWGAAGRYLPDPESAPTRVTGTGRDLGKVRHLEEAGVELVAADLMDHARMRKLVEGRDVVFHLGAWLGGDDDRAEAVNVEATAALVAASAAAGVGRFVHVSTIAVYGLPPDGAVIDEEWDLDTGGVGGGGIGVYARTKARGELRGGEVDRGSGMEWTVVRPGMVWGPGSRGWTIRVARAVCGGKPILIGGGRGHFHGIYVANLVDLLLLAAVHPGAPDRAFNATEAPTTWKEYADRYGALCGAEPRSVPLSLARVMAALSRLPGVRLPVDGVQLAMATRRPVYSSERARTVLGWEPRRSVEEGMDETAEWLRREGVLPPPVGGSAERGA